MVLIEGTLNAVRDIINILCSNLKISVQKPGIEANFPFPKKITIPKQS